MKVYFIVKERRVSPTGLEFSNRTQMQHPHQITKSLKCNLEWTTTTRDTKMARKTKHQRQYENTEHNRLHIKQRNKRQLMLTSAMLVANGVYSGLHDHNHPTCPVTIC